jgi:hypothetical protein
LSLCCFSFSATSFFPFSSFLSSSSLYSLLIFIFNVITCTTACSESEKVNDCRLGGVHLYNFWKPLFYCAGKTCKMSSVAEASYQSVSMHCFVHIQVHKLVHPHESSAGGKVYSLFLITGIPLYRYNVQ